MEHDGEVDEKRMASTAKRRVHGSESHTRHTCCLHGITGMYALIEIWINA